jgi:hypothetical protein
MNHSAPKARDYEWLDYYEQFQYFSAEAVRDRCHPRIMEHEERRLRFDQSAAPTFLHYAPTLFLRCQTCRCKELVF